MDNFLRPEMAEATRLTRQGRLGEATALIQRMLGGAPAPAARTRPAEPGTLLLEGPDAPRAETIRRPRRPVPGGRPRAGLAETLRRLGAGHAFKGHPRPAVPPIPEGARFDGHRYADAGGARDYKLYQPAARPAEAMPLVVMLHGCTQNPDDFAAGTRMNALAEVHGFLVAYPEQPASANANRCWNWFRPEDQGRGGEPALIAGIVRRVVTEHRVDPERVYAAGLSAGGAAAAVLGAAYPDLFAAVGVHSGLPVGAARDVPTAFAAMRRAGTASAAGSGVATIVFHGDTDPTVDPANGGAVIAQAVPAGRVEHEVGAAGDRRYTRALHRDASGRVVGEHWTVHGGGHAWSGGSPAGSYADPAGPDASAEMLRFFLARRQGGGTAG
jgi:poly(hydroxyalkanoate) depolymerase family esterase